MGNIAENIAHHLDYMTGAIQIGGFAIPRGVYTTWGIMIVLVLLSVWFTRKMEVVPKRKRQVVIEGFIGMLYNVFYNILGEHGKQYIPYLLTLILYLGLANMVGLFGFVPPTKDLNVTVALALMSTDLARVARLLVAEMVAELSLPGTAAPLASRSTPTVPVLVLLVATTE